MSAEVKRRNQRLRAARVAECLFEDENYHTVYVEDLNQFMKADV